MYSCRDLELYIGWSATNAEGDLVIMQFGPQCEDPQAGLGQFFGQPLHNGNFELFALLMAVKVSCFLLLMYAGNQDKCLNWSHW